GLRPGRPGGAGGSGRHGQRAGGAEPAAGLTSRRSGAGTPSRRDPQPVGTEMESLLASRGWRGQVQVGSVVGRWPAIVGETVAAHVAPVAFEGTTLTVQADSTAWATQMRLLTNSVLARIETEVGDDVVTQIVVHGPAGPTWRKGPLRAPGAGPRDTYG
ncbi:DUF721 domain-containing protein, partial [Ornithinicoccus halotolerans]|uniref:DUF721 domain-containing protein n=1 Tax=Ornithinicoccus halotolerans TaxID=1748220 RepID=UPI001295F2D3